MRSYRYNSEEMFVFHAYKKTQAIKDLQAANRNPSNLLTFYMSLNEILADAFNQYSKKFKLHSIKVLYDEMGNEFLKITVSIRHQRDKSKMGTPHGACSSVSKFYKKFHKLPLHNHQWLHYEPATSNEDIVASLESKGYDFQAAF